MLPSWSEPPYYSLLVEDDDLNGTDSDVRLAAAVEEELRRQNGEYANRQDTRRLGPARIVRIPPGSWSAFQKRRLARSGGAVEQYKQPHLIPDLNQIETFHPVATQGR